MLKSLELFGFKSFAERTRFDFAAGITGVVGPNGSGKSNVVDAVKWILGDQSAKSLRGEEMTDVIFNGAAGRAPSQFAEAVLTFDNSSGFLPVEAAEVQIGRRLWRGGDSEYLINRRTARRKDLIDLLRGTGAGSAAYSIIEQGRVDQILQASATTRRNVFEEAAGISRFKARRIEAERKLERVAQHVERLTDLVDQLEAQLTATRSQAAKAAAFRELSNELKELWLGLAADDHRRLSARLEEVERSRTECGEQIEQHSGRLSELEAALAEQDERLADADQRLRGTERRRGEARETIVRHEATIRHQSARVTELEAEQARLRRQRSIMAVRLREVLAEREHNCGVLEVSRREIAAGQDDMLRRDHRRDDLQEHIAVQRQSIERDRQAHLKRVREFSTTENRIESIESQREALAAQNAEAERKISEFDEQIAQAVRQRDRQAGLVRETLLAVEAAQERLQRLHDQRQTLQSQHDQARRTLADLRERRSAGLARRSVLDDLEQRQEGLSIGVREILHRAETSPYPPWNEIIGSVADLLEVDLENAALLEVALGHRAQLIVLKAYEPLMEYLRQGQCRIEGQVGFLAHFFVAPPDGERARDGEGASPQAAESPLTTHHSPLRTSSNLCDRPGVLGRADRLVRASRKIPRLAEHLLADTWIVETLDVALALSAGDGRGCRFVTLQGELLEAEGTLFVGTIKSETALLSRKSELRRLKSDLTTLDEEIAEQERRLAEMHDSLHASRSERSSAESESARNADRLTAEKSRFAALEDNLSRLARDRESVQAERAGGAARSARLAEEQSAFQSARAETEAELAALEEAMQQAETALTELTAALQSLDQEQTTARMQLAKQEERLTGLETELERLDAEERTRFAQRDEVERRCAAVHAKRREALLQILNTGALLSEAALVQESLSELLERLLADKDELRLARGKNQAEQARLGKQLRGLEEKRHAADMQARDLSTQLAALAERIAEEFQAALPEVVASGASAYGASPQTASFEEVRPELEARVSRLRKKLKLMGSVNTDSLRGLDELEERFAYLSAQRQDLVEAKAALEDIIRRINHESKRLFVETFERIRSHFQHLFRQAFGGGDGDIVLEDPNDVLECGIDIVARPPGKELKSISLMSGGEKTLTAFALLLALFRSRPSPYCVLDEVDAALDEANVGRLTALLGEFRATTQFVIITHKKPTMTICDLLYGVTMEQSGISKRVSVRFEDVGEQGDIQAAPERRAAA